MINNKRFLVTEGMYRPDKLYASTEMIATLNYRLNLYEIIKETMISNNLYN